MPQFKVRRKRTRPVSPKPSIEAKVDHMEVDDTQTEIDSAFESLNMKPARDVPETTNYETTPMRVDPPAQLAPSQLARQTSNPAHPARYGPPREPPNYRRRFEYPQRQQLRPILRRQRENKIHFRSHYGIDGDLISTQEKSQLLYTSCFDY